MTDTDCHPALSGTATGCPPLPAGPHPMTVLSDLAAVEELLDALEAAGRTGLEVIALGNDGFVVRWR